MTIRGLPCLTVALQRLPDVVTDLGERSADRIGEQPPRSRTSPRHRRHNRIACCLERVLDSLPKPSERIRHGLVWLCSRCSFSLSTRASARSATSLRHPACWS
jgi:hypothetical protein